MKKYTIILEPDTEEGGYTVWLSWRFIISLWARNMLELETERMHV